MLLRLDKERKSASSRGRIRRGIVRSHVMNSGSMAISCWQSLKLIAKNSSNRYTVPICLILGALLYKLSSRSRNSNTINTPHLPQITTATMAYDINRNDANTEGTVDAKSNLLTIPRELRDKIYRYLLVSETPLVEVLPSQAVFIRMKEEGRNDIRQFQDTTAWMDNKSMYHKLIDTRILRVNHQLHAESSEIFIRKNTFKIGRYGLITDRSYTMGRVTKVQVDGGCIWSLEEMARLVRRLKWLISMLRFHNNKDFRTFQVEMSVPSHNWVLDYYGIGQDMRHILNALKYVRVDGRLEFKIGFRYPCWRSFNRYHSSRLSYDPETKEQELFVEGMNRLKKVMTGESSAADFEWPRY